MNCNQCEYDKLPEEKRPVCCNVIHERKIQMVCDAFKKTE
jgi:hypothetical protein